MEFFTISRLYVHISQKRLKIEAYKQRIRKNALSLRYPTVACVWTHRSRGFYRVGQKLSDVIPVLRITPTATEPSTVSVFLSVVKCRRVYSVNYQPYESRSVKNKAATNGGKRRAEHSRRRPSFVVRTRRRRSVCDGIEVIRWKGGKTPPGHNTLGHNPRFLLP